MNSKTKIAITVISGLLLSLIAVVFGFKPLLNNVRELNQTLSLKQSELLKIEKQIVEFKSAQSDLARATFKDDVYGTIVIREDLSLVLEDMEAAAEKTNTTESIQITESAEEEGNTRRNARNSEATATVFEDLVLSEEVRYTMNLSNNYAGLVDFMQYMENLPHFTEFDRISLSSVVENLQGGNSRNTGEITGTLEGVFLVKKNGKAQD